MPLTINDHSRLSQEAIDRFDRDRAYCLANGDINGYLECCDLIEHTRRTSYLNIKELESLQKELRTNEKTNQ
jgi:hypothetical protein